ncbi:MAG TPA: sugar ABC transporter permease [Candidatus Merdenecus merdavium]|nr:sugar ABC transporter permease [Candidatus Merdenecus merdavium]
MLSRKPKKSVLFAYLIVPMLLYVFSVFVPLVAAGFYSFFQWKGGPNKTFIGLENYVTLMKDSVFWEAFGHNIYLVILCVIGQVGIAFLFVIIINSKLVKLKGIHRTFGFFPSTISAVAVGFIWTMIYDSRRGLLNWFLEAIGQGAKTQVWLNNPKIVMTLVAIPLIWQYIGYYMIILLSATASIDSEILESAELDGANTVQRAIHVILPMIKSTIMVCIVLCVSGNMKAFDNIYVMTTGGPGNSSMVMALYGYKVSFTQQNMGYGSAISVAIFVLGLLVIGGIQLLSKIVNKNEEVV